MKRNDVVGINGYGHVMYGRISRFIGRYHVEVVDCGRYRSLHPIDRIEVFPEYKGYWDTIRIPGTGKIKEFTVWRPMPTLRKLKQMSRKYDKGVWKKNRPKQLELEEWPNGDRESMEDARGILLLYGPG